MQIAVKKVKYKIDGLDKASQFRPITFLFMQRPNALRFRMEPIGRWKAN